MKSVNFNGKHLNLDAVKSYYFSDGLIWIEYTDGTKEAFAYRDSISTHSDMTGAQHIVQVLPAPIPLWVVNECGYGGHTAERVLFFGLCADGSLYPLGSMAGFFDIENSIVGLYTETGLARFENLTHVGLIDPPEYED
jgi:hypothetical protein